MKDGDPVRLKGAVPATGNLDDDLNDVLADLEDQRSQQEEPYAGTLSLIPALGAS